MNKFQYITTDIRHWNPYHLVINNVLYELDGLLLDTTNYGKVKLEITTILTYD